MDTQDEDARIWAAGNGHTIVGIASDRISGRVSPFDRRDLGPWLNDPSRIALYDGILVAKIDRLTRKRDWDIRQWAEEHEKRILVVSPELEWPPKPGDVATPIIWDDLVNLAAGEWENTSQRYRRMQRALRDQAYFVGKCPYGYHIVAVDGTEHKTLAPDPVTSAIVRGMVKRYLDGQSLRQIRDWLNTSAIPVPAPSQNRKNKGWHHNTVRLILQNPAIIGRIRTSGKTYLRVEPLISAEDFQSVQELMTSHAHRGAPPQRTALLTSIAVCDKGNPMHRIQGRKIPSVPDGQYYYCRDNCPKGSRILIPLAYLDARVHDEVMSMKDQRHLVMTVTPGDDYSNEIDRVLRDLKEIDPEDDAQEAERPKLRAELKRLRKLQSESKPKPSEPKEDGKTVGEVWESLDTAGRRQWLLARRGSHWIPGQDKARVQVGARDPERGEWSVDIDLGAYTDWAYSLATL